jgi:hypothetical protein
MKNRCFVDLFRIFLSFEVSRIEIVNGSKVRVYLQRQPFVPSYYFIIGSLEAFETKLDALQNELNLKPEQRLIVRYTEEVNLLYVFYTQTYKHTHTHTHAVIPQSQFSHETCSYVMMFVVFFYFFSSVTSSIV